MEVEEARARAGGGRHTRVQIGNLKYITCAIVSHGSVAALVCGTIHAMDEIGRGRDGGAKRDN